MLCGSAQQEAMADGLRSPNNSEELVANT